jgi:polysaccharide biosynthesis/export protein
MRFRGIVLLTCLLLAAAVAYADNGTSQQASSSSSSSSPPAQFGLQATIFNNVQQPSTNIQNNVSNLKDFVPSPGDIYTLTIDYGTTSITSSSSSTATSYRMELNDDMTLDVPYIGTVDVKNQTFPEIRKTITDDIRKTLPVVYVNFAITSPAEFNVFVYGGVNSPGPIEATTLVTVTAAIAEAKGFKSDASYRSVELIRGGRHIVLDLSKYFVNADQTANPQLKPGDQIYVPPAKTVVTLTGEVNFPGTYELLPSENLATLFAFAGGLTRGALTSRIEVTRIGTDGTRQLVTTNMQNASTFSLQNGDAIDVLSSSGIGDVVTVEGAIYGKARSGTTPVDVPSSSVRVDFPYYPGLSLLSVLDAVGGPTPFEVPNASYLIRNGATDHQPLPVDKLWSTHDASLDVPLQPGDHIIVPIQTLKVFITGHVVSPGAEPYDADTTVKQYLLFAGGVVENIGDPNGVYLVASDGTRTKLTMDDHVPAGSNIYVAMTPLFSTNQKMQDFFVTTGWVTQILAIVTAMFNFYELFKGVIRF